MESIVSEEGTDEVFVNAFLGCCTPKILLCVVANKLTTTSRLEAKNINWGLRIMKPHIYWRVRKTTFLRRFSLLRKQTLLLA